MPTARLLQTLAFWIALLPLASGQLEIVQDSVASGGGLATGGPFRLHGTVGQPDATPRATGRPSNLILYGGFWGPTETIHQVGYPVWAAANIADPSQRAFGADANGDSMPNGLEYILGPNGFGVTALGQLTPLPSSLPSDVVLVLETSTDGQTWQALLRYDLGAISFQDASIVFEPHAITHTSPDPVRLYRYLAIYSP